MPFRSQAQRGFMFARHPEIAQRWAAEYPNQGKLPMRVSQGPRARVAGALMGRLPKVRY
jgi:hypothetical protein